jgi:tripartite-type tricarboxylate transporter receptor subunit TctC
MVSGLAGSDEQRAALQFYLTRSAVGRPFVAPPRVPEDRVAALRKAFDDTMHDPAFVDETRRAQMDLSPNTGQELAQVFDSAYRTPRTVIERAIRAMSSGTTKEPTK